MKDWLHKIFIASVAALAPIHAVILSVGFLIIADLITGILAAYKRKEKITSAAMRRTISKIVVYQLAVISGFLLEAYLLDKLLPISKIVAGVIGIVEFKSILENSNYIIGQDIFKALIKKLGSENDKFDK
jgi:hypothetical protein